MANQPTVENCTHSRMRPPDFDLNEAREMSAHDIQLKFPRYQGECPDCGKFLTIYASPEHRNAGGW